MPHAALALPPDSTCHPISWLASFLKSGVFATLFDTPALWWILNMVTAHSLHTTYNACSISPSRSDRSGFVLLLASRLIVVLLLPLVSSCGWLCAWACSRGPCPEWRNRLAACSLSGESSHQSLFQSDLAAPCFAWECVRGCLLLLLFCVLAESWGVLGLSCGEDTVVS